MASYTAVYPIAYHVVPLFALKGVWARGALLSKADGTVVARPSTARVDRLLGVERYVHFYLSASELAISSLPILAARLTPRRGLPFPHAVLELPTAALSDAESLLCNWNMAVSRPLTADVKGGNWDRRTRPERIAEVWRAFRAEAPALTRARGLFNDPILVPTLWGEQIGPNLKLLKKAPRGMPELLLASPVALARFARLHVFSEADKDVLALLGSAPLPMVETDFPGYDAAQVSDETRRGIEAFFRSDESPPEFAFDEI